MSNQTLEVSFEEILSVLCPDRDSATVALAERIRKEILVLHIRQNTKILLNLEDYSFRTNFLHSLFFELGAKEKLTRDQIALVSVKGNHKPSVNAAKYYLQTASNHSGKTLADLQRSQAHSSKSINPIDVLLKGSNNG